MLVLALILCGDPSPDLPSGLIGLPAERIKAIERYYELSKADTDGSIRSLKEAIEEDSEEAKRKGKNSTAARRLQRYREDLRVLEEGRKLVRHEISDQSTDKSQVGFFSQGFRIAEVVGPTKLRVTRGEMTLFIEGMPTEGLIDDQVINLPIVFQPIGAESYTTIVGATKTIPAFRVVAQDGEEFEAQTLLLHRHRNPSESMPKKKKRKGYQ